MIVQRARLLSLTSRQSEVAFLVHRDLTDAEIARSLGLRLSTVRSYLKAIYRRLGLRGRGGLMLEVERSIVNEHLCGEGLALTALNTCRTPLGSQT